MPYNPVERTATITVLAVTLEFSVSPALPWRGGQTVTLKGRLLTNTTPWVGQTVDFYRRTAEEPLPTRIGSAVTGSDGVATLTWTVPHGLACTLQRFWARHEPTDTISTPVTGGIAFPTRVSIAAPASVAPGQSFTISGKLEYESSAGVWSPLAGRTVYLFYDGTMIAQVITAADGTYSATVSIPASGTYTLKASFAGEGLALAAFALFGIGVGVPPELEPIVQYATYALAAIPVLAVVGAVGYVELTKRR